MVKLNTIDGNYYVKCGGCRRIIEDNNNKLSCISEPSPCCGDKSIRTLWPSPYVTAYLDLISNLSSKDENGEDIQIVFLSTALEILMEDTLRELLLSHTTTIQSLEAILEGYQGRERRISLFNKLSNRKLDIIFNDSGFPNFIGNWGQIVSWRNCMVHGNYNKNINSDLVGNVLKECIPAFIKVNDAIQNQKK